LLFSSSDDIGASSSPAKPTFFLPVDTQHDAI
jgi:hypothetical protein